MNKQLSMAKAKLAVILLAKALPEATVFSNPRKPHGRMIKWWHLSEAEAKMASRTLTKNKIDHKVDLGSKDENVPRWHRAKPNVRIYTSRDFTLGSVTARKKVLKKKSAVESRHQTREGYLKLIRAGLKTASLLDLEVIAYRLAA